MDRLNQLLKELEDFRERARALTTALPASLLQKDVKEHQQKIGKIVTTVETQMLHHLEAEIRRGGSSQEPNQ